MATEKCKKCGKEPVTHKSLGLGDKCYKIRRAKQTKINNEAWIARKAKGKASNRTFYDGSLTTWARTHPEKVRKEFSKLDDPKLKKDAMEMLDKAVAAQAKKEAKAPAKKSAKAAPAKKKLPDTKKLKTGTRKVIAAKPKEEPHTDPVF